MIKILLRFSVNKLPPKKDLDEMLVIKIAFENPVQKSLAKKDDIGRLDRNIMEVLFEIAVKNLCKNERIKIVRIIAFRNSAQYVVKKSLPEKIPSKCSPNEDRLKVLNKTLLNGRRQKGRYGVAGQIGVAVNMLLKKPVEKIAVEKG